MNVSQSWPITLKLPFCSIKSAFSSAVGWSGSAAKGKSIYRRVTYLASQNTQWTRLQQVYTLSKGPLSTLLFMWPEAAARRVKVNHRKSVLLSRSNAPTTTTTTMKISAHCGNKKWSKPQCVCWAAQVKVRVDRSDSYQTHIISSRK